MKAIVFYLALLSMVPASMWAQAEEDIDLGLDPVYSEPVVTGGSSQTLGVSGENNKQPIYILNQASPAATAQVQKQPTTYIESSPVGESRAEQMRRARQDTELQTELRIVEKLEQSRIEDEKRRAQALFGDNLNSLNQNNSAVIVSEPQPSLSSDLVREEVRAALAENDAAKTVVAQESRGYVSAIVGMADYIDARNVKSDAAIGIGIGSKSNDRLLAEVDFIFSNHEMDYPWPVAVDQYSAVGQVKYQLSHGMLRPLLGAALAFNYRDYSDRVFNSDRSTSTALDVGLVAGADVQVSNDFSLGVDLRYMWNMTYKSSGYYQAYYSNEKPFDEFNYYVFGVNARFMF